jgi:hypothetical protein
MISGSVAAIEYGEPRATLDLDIAILLTPQSADSLTAAFQESAYYCPPREVLVSEIVTIQVV